MPMINLVELWETYRASPPISLTPARWILKDEDYMTHDALHTIRRKRVVDYKFIIEGAGFVIPPDHQKLFA